MLLTTTGFGAADTGATIKSTGGGFTSVTTLAVLLAGLPFSAVEPAVIVLVCRPLEIAVTTLVRTTPPPGFRLPRLQILVGPFWVLVAPGGRVLVKKANPAGKIFVTNASAASGPLLVTVHILVMLLPRMT